MEQAVISVAGDPDRVLATSLSEASTGGVSD
jgi:hypothetical protein